MAQATADHEPITFTAREENRRAAGEEDGRRRPNTMLITR